MSHWISTAEAWTHVTYYEREAAQQKLNFALINGVIPTWAKFFTFRGKEYHNAEMPVEFWRGFQSGTFLDYAKGTSHRVINHLAAFPNPKGKGYIVPTISDDRAEGICLALDALYSMWPKVANTDKPKSTQHPHPGGRSFAADWPAHEEALEAEIRLFGFPRRDGPPGWRYLSDAVRSVESRLSKDETPSPTTLKDNVAKMLTRIKAKMDGN